MWEKLFQSWSCEWLKVSVAKGPLEPGQVLPKSQRGCGNCRQGAPSPCPSPPRGPMRGHTVPQPVPPKSPARRLSSGFGILSLEPCLPSVMYLPCLGEVTLLM